MLYAYIALHPIMFQDDVSIVLGSIFLSLVLVPRNYHLSISILELVEGKHDRNMRFLLIYTYIYGDIYIYNYII